MDDKPYNVDFSAAPAPDEFSEVDDFKFILWGFAALIGVPLSIGLLVWSMWSVLK